MNTKNTTKTFIITLAMTLALAIVPTMAFGQSFGHGNINIFQNNDLVGVWQTVVIFRDCHTGVPLGSFQTLRTFMQGETMSETNPSFPTSGHGIWKRTSGRQYTVALAFYAFEPNGDFAGNAKIKEYIMLSHNFNSYTSDSTFEFFDPNGNVVDSGCSTETATRFTF